MTPLHGCCGTPAWNRVGPIGRTISFMADWPPLVFYGRFLPFGHSTSPWPFMASGHISNPQVSIFVFGPGGVLSLGGLGPKWSFWAIYTPYALYGPWAKGGSPLAFKARWVPNHDWAHLSPILATITMTSKIATTRSAQLNPSPQLKGSLFLLQYLICQSILASQKVSVQHSTCHTQKNQAVRFPEENLHPVLVKTAQMWFQNHI
ncbi:hypothetical protein O181_054930 [Austropuccinia psidii MF-1]|uniref:Uncharacterized protein n=1 Tax=Austropuccinia psidii MF-1 TaxID=1389203 RepID=A0A9Q3HUT0_9BASI|nr:hypothetical protein [Austropuccinia psidii MF-1]